MESDSSEEYKFAYQKFGLQSFSDKVDKVESAFNEKLNDVVHIMVQDALCLEDATVTRESFVLRVRDTVPIGELRVNTIINHCSLCMISLGYNSESI